MWRSLFLALGAFSCIVGLECLFLDKAVMFASAPAATASARNMPAVSAKKELAPPPWAPWSLMSVGSVVILYSFTVPEKLKT